MYRLRTDAVRRLLCPWVSICLVTISFAGVVSEASLQDAPEPPAQDGESQASSIDPQPGLSPAPVVVWNVLERMQSAVLRNDRMIRIAQFVVQTGEALPCILPVRLLSSAQPLGP